MISLLKVFPYLPPFGTRYKLVESACIAIVCVASMLLSRALDHFLMFRSSYRFSFPVTILQIHLLHGAVLLSLCRLVADLLTRFLIQPPSIIRRRVDWVHDAKLGFSSMWRLALPWTVSQVFRVLSIYFQPISMTYHLAACMTPLAAIVAERLLVPQQRPRSPRFNYAVGALAIGALGTTLQRNVGHYKSKGFVCEVLWIILDAYTTARLKEKIRANPNGCLRFLAWVSWAALLPLDIASLGAVHVLKHFYYISWAKFGMNVGVCSVVYWIDKIALSLWLKSRSSTAIKLLETAFICVIVTSHLLGSWSWHTENAIGLTLAAGAAYVLYKEDAFEFGKW